MFMWKTKFYHEGEAGAAGGGAAPAGNAGAAAGGAGAAAPAGTAGDAGGAGAAPAGDWMSGFSEDHKQYVKAKGFKDGGSIIDSYRNSEKLITELKGAAGDRLIKVPEKPDDVNGWNEFFDKAGRPKTADGYEIKFDDKFGGENLAKWMKDQSHKLGLSKNQAEKFSKEFTDFSKSAIDNMEATAKTKAQEGVNLLKSEWGAALEKNSLLVERAASTLGLTEANLLALRDSMGGVEAMRFMHKLAIELGGEDKFLTGDKKSDGFGSALSPTEAQARIEHLKKDAEWAKKYLGGDITAKQEMEKLHRWAYGA